MDKPSWNNIVTIEIRGEHKSYARINTTRGVRCSPILGQRELEFSEVLAQVGVGADEPFMNEIGTLLPIALCGRNSLYNTTT